MPKPTEFHRRMPAWRVIVTGAGTEHDGVGVGSAISRLMAAEGARVALLDLDRERAENTQQSIIEDNGEAAVFICDVTRAEDCHRAVTEAVAWLGGLDVLVNNVGMGTGPTRIDAMDPAAFRAGIDVNLTSAFLISRAAMPALLEGAGKAVVNIASIAGIRAYGGASYGPAKAALIQFTNELALVYGREGLRANTVAPGHIFTPMVANFAAAREVRRQIAPLGIEGDAWDVALAALFLASSEARFITGVCLPVDGGATAIGPWAAYNLVQS